MKIVRTQRIGRKCHSVRYEVAVVRCNTKQPGSGTACLCTKPKGHVGMHQYWEHRWGKGKPTKTERLVTKAVRAVKKANDAIVDAHAEACVSKDQSRELIGHLRDLHSALYGLALECRHVASIAVPLVLLALLLTGCFSYYPIGTPANPTSQAVLNNTPFLLDIYQDGVCIGKNVPTGQLVPVRPTIWQRYSCVTVTGYTTTGVYMGANTYTFEVHAVETWAVNKLEIPRP